ncbi:hypothetical protein JVU11DRAFT_7263 [Chiua virens]|nr:hypothetical protein JVU11DRAFT_7263 [Chiua virens]
MCVFHEFLPAMVSISAGGEIYGPMLIGTLLNCILYGATVVQAYIYFQTYKGDKRWMKMFVLYMLIFETLNTACDIGVIYEPLILHFGSPQVLQVAPLLLPASGYRYLECHHEIDFTDKSCEDPITTVMISFPVQLFIVWRVKKLTKSIVLPLIISFFAFASFVGGILISALLISIDFQYSQFHHNDSALIVWLASAAVADTLITASLVHSLLRKRTGFAATDDVINRIIRLTIQTGMMTAIFAIMDVTLFTLGKTWNFIWDIPLSKLYSNTILSTLNARHGWKSSETARDNVLFGNETSFQCDLPKGRSQIEIRSGSELPVQQMSIAASIPMKVFDSGSGQAYDREDSFSVVNVVHKYGHAV